MNEDDLYAADQEERSFTRLRRNAGSIEEYFGQRSGRIQRSIFSGLLQLHLGRTLMSLPTLLGEALFKKLSIPSMIVLPLGGILFYRPIWGLSEALFFLLTGMYLLIAAEVVKKGE